MLTKNDFKNVTRYVYVGWPAYQEILDLEGFDDNACQDAEESGYFVDEKWLNGVLPDETCDKE